MPEINGRTLMMAIQAVDFKINDIVKQLDDTEDADSGELELLLLSYEKVAAQRLATYKAKDCLILPPADASFIQRIAQTDISSGTCCKTGHCHVTAAIAPNRSHATQTNPNQVATMKKQAGFIKKPWLFIWRLVGPRPNSALCRIGCKFAPSRLLNKCHKSRLAPPSYQLCCEILIFAGASSIDCYTIPCVPPLAVG